MALILGPDGSSLSVLLAELLLLFVAADPSGYYGCFGRVEKADGDLRFVARRSRTGEVTSLSRSLPTMRHFFLNVVAVIAWLVYLPHCLLAVSELIDALSLMLL